jgi:long-chain acyl-CoA synthetase
MEKIWLKHYPKGIPHTVDIDPNQTIISMFDDAVIKYGDKIADECLGVKISYNKLNELSDVFASYCQNKLGLKKGDVLGIMSPNLIQYHIAIFGAHKAGLTVTGINPMYTPKELEYQFQDANIKAVVVLENFASVVEKTIKTTPVEHIIVTTLGDMHSCPKRFILNFVVRKIKKMVPKYNLPNAIPFRQVLEDGVHSECKRPPMTGDDLSFLQYTGGTTGKSKGVMLTHTNIIANIKQIHTLLSPVFDGKQEEIWLAPLPMFHIFALTASFVPMLAFGHKNLFVPNPRDLKMFIKIAKNNKFTLITGVNTLFSALAYNKDFQAGDYSSLKVSWAGGMPVQEHVAHKWHEVTGCPLQVAYGLSETSPGVSADFYNTKEFSGSIGYPFPNTDVEIRDTETGEVKPLGESGEICVKGPQVMKGYLNKPEETAKSLQDGWFKTGDVGIMNENGQIKLVDRTKDMVIVSGFNVYTVEVEHVIAHMPEVLDVAVIGVPNKKTGEALKAHIVLKEGRTLTAQQVIDYCHENITRYKTPKLISFNESLPLSPVGKILKTELRKLPENTKYFEEAEKEN